MNNRVVADSTYLKLASKAKATFNTPDGKDFLAHLEYEFYHVELGGQDPYQTERNVGAHGVVLYIRELLEVKGE